MILQVLHNAVNIAHLLKLEAPVHVVDLNGMRLLLFSSSLARKALPVLNSLGLLELVLQYLRLQTRWVAWAYDAWFDVLLAGPVIANGGCTVCWTGC